jgi:asparagine N-glycosylation enzyme membrane subunit Stt3
MLRYWQAVVILALSGALIAFGLGWWPGDPLSLGIIGALASAATLIDLAHG